MSLEETLIFARDFGIIPAMVGPSEVAKAFRSCNGGAKVGVIYAHGEGGGLSSSEFQSFLVKVNEGLYLTSAAQEAESFEDFMIKIAGSGGVNKIQMEARRRLLSTRPFTIINLTLTLIGRSVLQGLLNKRNSEPSFLEDEAALSNWREKGEKQVEQKRLEAKNAVLFEKAEMMIAEKRVALSLGGCG